ncbi:hypothetical protein DPEC_G00200000 [Dallia pectoralis]|uniref:Uncharacterized protein n=1 Tax=Dallia pectoralis TaxID=75939 RepID=A0ACC2G8L3_DALPE|nr:hypothetical protein DPEC_G00200000 [Dallia pectoralis]
MRERGPTGVLLEKKNPTCVSPPEDEDGNLFGLHHPKQKPSCLSGTAAGSHARTYARIGRCLAVLRNQG